MGRMPDLSGLIYFAIFGMACAATVAAGIGIWLAYHPAAALSAHLGA
jgi:hypothetical protein